jgi:hypothetical protein
MIITLVIRPDVKRWYKNNLVHRENGPAIITDNVLAYYIENKRIKWEPK